MKLFHGGTACIEHPKMLDSQRHLDFGPGFYTTTSQEQADAWSQIKCKRLGAGARAIVSIYEITDALLQGSQYKLKIFERASEEWLDFVIKNRNGTQPSFTTS